MENRRYHALYLRAVNNPVRREILRSMSRGAATLQDLQSSTGLDDATLRWHLSILEHGFCVKKDEEHGKAFYRLTQEGKIVDHLE